MILPKIPKGSDHVTRNVILGLAGVGGASFITAIIFGLISGPYAVLVALIAFLWSLPVYCIILAIIFFIAGKKSEGGVCLLAGFSVLLFGFIVCGGFIF